MDRAGLIKILPDQVKQIQENQWKLKKIKIILDQLQVRLPLKIFGGRAITCALTKPRWLNIGSGMTAGLIQEGKEVVPSTS